MSIVRSYDVQKISVSGLPSGAWRQEMIGSIMRSKNVKEGCVGPTVRRSRNVNWLAHSYGIPTPREDPIGRPALEVDAQGLKRLHE